MKPMQLDEMPPLTDEQIAGFLDVCRRNPDNHLVWGNDTVGRIILTLQGKARNSL